MIAHETARSRFTGWLMAIFAASALLLAMIGIYGVMSYSVSRRTQEIGIRVALGAARSDVLKMVVRRGMGLIAAGLALGTRRRRGLTRLMASLLYGVTATDLVQLRRGVPLVLAAVAFLACLIPASRASRIHPAIALRTNRVVYFPTTRTWKLSGSTGGRPFLPSLASGAGPYSAASR